MEHSADREPDVLAQGCRAFGALYATPNNEVNLGLKPGEKMKSATASQLHGMIWANSLEGGGMETVKGLRKCICVCVCVFVFVY